MSVRIIRYLFLAILSIGLAEGCANITTPTGGKRDKIPPRLVSIDPADSLLNTKVKRIELYFNEYITVADANKEVTISPILSIAPAVTGLNKHVIVKIVDSLLEDNTTYRLSFGNSIKDLHEGNPFRNYTYTFSTGNFFDSLELFGTVINAATGLADTGGVYIVLYSANENDSAVMHHKPKYVAKVDAQGTFTFKGLPKRAFNIYAIKDVNNNLIYDGPEAGEMIAFIGSPVLPGDTAQAPIDMRLFGEIPDTATKKKIDSADRKMNRGLGANKSNKTVNKQTGLNYTVGVDTTAPTKRTFDITQPLDIMFSTVPELNREKITLSYDSLGNDIYSDIALYFDSLRPGLLHIKTNWAEDKEYTLKLRKGFAKDTAGNEVLPGKYVFHTKDDDDYGKIKVQLPGKYNDPKFVLLVTTDKDTIYQKPIKDTLVSLTRLKQDKYTFRIIVDKNGNGKWDPGNFLGKLQPEEVIPYTDVITVKAGWDNTIDFVEKPKPGLKSKATTTGKK